MGKQVDLELINSRSREREQIVQDGKYFETIEGEGRTPEGIKAAARKVLGLPEDGIILLEANETMMKQNKKTQSLVLFLNATSVIADDLGLTQGEKLTVEHIRTKAEKELCSTYNIGLEDLYREDV